MQSNRKKMMDERVMRDLNRAFPTPDPEKHRYIIEKEGFGYALYDSRPDTEKPGEWITVPVAKFSFHDGEQVWQLSWMPPQGRWQKYGRYFDIETATLIVKADPAGNFMGAISPLAYLKQTKKDGE
ncbi:MAG: DUF3024 domain-containing protein [Nitrospirae bacterium]|nr:DUF3024 domain-containing protein [Nitrospirota bacterium]